MFKRRIKTAIAVFFVLLTLQGCGLLRNKPLTTPTGIELSKPLSSVTYFLDDFQRAYRLLKVMTDEIHNAELMSDEQFDKIADFAETVRTGHAKTKILVSAWYQAESNGDVLDRTEQVAQVISELTDNFESLVNMVKEEADLTDTQVKQITSIWNMVKTFAEPL